MRGDLLLEPFALPGRPDQLFFLEIFL